MRDPGRGSARPPLFRRLPAPASLDELRERAALIGGRSLAALAWELGATAPDDLRRHKGWVGQLIEAALGAPGGGAPTPDLAGLGVELKTIPIDAEGRPLESTWVCSAPMDGSMEPTWAGSHVRQKLAKVLWVPILTEPGAPPAARRVGEARLWSPSPAEEALLQADWEELAEIIARGERWLLRADRGRVLQLRPKAANREDKVWVVDEEGRWITAVPQGFYLRSRFTADLLTTLRDR